jgi:hypothetical protein
MPVERMIWPASPFEVVPVLREMSPDTPATPALKDFRLISPDEDAEENPEATLTIPPVLPVP